ncbi:MAG: sulfoxide reductase heme-binding subunit YedZ [Caldilineales bacterium]|nr:sulfoxide reductase heme-binding subunit YedZ [Caldilineales bacterium]
MKHFQFTKFQIAVHVGSLIPLAYLIFDIVTGNLSVNPIQDITFRTGKAALVLLVLALAVTPINTVTGFRQVIKVRRALGLYAFLYAAIHLFIFAFIDYGLDLRLIWLETTEKRYIYIGFAAFLILLPLAITSTKGWQKRLGKTWKTLHKWVYLAGCLVVLHYAWVQKSDIRQPIVFGVIVVLLLALRIPRVRRRISHWRGRHFSSRKRRPATSKPDMLETSV